VDIWCEGFLENVSFELRVKKVEVGLWTVIVVMIGEISLDDWDEKLSMAAPSYGGPSPVGA